MRRPSRFHRAIAGNGTDRYVFADRSEPGGKDVGRTKNSWQLHVRRR